MFNMASAEVLVLQCGTFRQQFDRIEGHLYRKYPLLILLTFLEDELRTSSRILLMRKSCLSSVEVDGNSMIKKDFIYFQALKLIVGNKKDCTIICK